MCHHLITEVELALSHLAMVRTDHDALDEGYGGVIQRIVNLEETLLRVEEKKF